MPGEEFVEAVIQGAVQATKPSTPLQQLVAEHMKGELDGSSPAGTVKQVIHNEIGRRATTPRHSQHSIPAR